MTIKRTCKKRNEGQSMFYQYFYLCYGIRYQDFNEFTKPLTSKSMYNWQKELCEQLDELSQQGWELVQLSPDLMDGKAIDGYGLFRKN